MAIGALLCVNAAMACAQLSGPSRHAIIGQRLSVILDCPATSSFNFPHPYLVADSCPNSGERSSQQKDDSQADCDGEDLEKEYKEYHFLNRLHKRRLTESFA
jgi:hypothetical protein